MTRRLPLVLAVLTTASLAACVDTVPSGNSAAKAAAAGLPPAGYAQEQWISPNGCTYIRAQAFDWAPTWHLVVNGSRIGMTNAKKGCAAVLYETSGGRPHH
jgi:hypothetical protein